MTNVSAARVLGRAEHLGAQLVGGIPYPTRVTKERPGEGHAIGATAGHDLVGLSGTGYQTDGERRETDRFLERGRADLASPSSPLAKTVIP